MCSRGPVLTDTQSRYLAMLKSLLNLFPVHSCLFSVCLLSLWKPTYVWKTRSRKPASTLGGSTSPPKPEVASPGTLWPPSPQTWLHHAAGCVNEHLLRLQAYNSCFTGAAPGRLSDGVFQLLILMLNWERGLLQKGLCIVSHNYLGNYSLRKYGQL